MKSFLLIAFCAAAVPAVLSVLDKALNEACSTDLDCSIAYSSCDKSARTCQCIKGFSADGNGLCKSPGLACPTWNGNPASQPGKSCTSKYDMSTGTESNSCGANEFCFTYPKTQTPTGYLEFIGHCCPKPPKDAQGLTMVCPLKVQDKSGTCPDMRFFPVDMAATGDKLRTCSWTTHDCIMREDKGACCPLPCLGLSSLFTIEGKCYDTGLIGDPCTHTAQCGGGSRCLPVGNGRSKQCQCNNGKAVQEPSPHCEN